MRKILCILAVILLASTAAASVEPDISVSKIDPQPSEPGDTVKVHLTVSNNGNSDGRFDPLEVETTEGISFSGTTSDFQESFDLCGGCQRTGTVYLKIDEDKNSGEYPVDIVLTHEDFGVVEKAELSVDGIPELVVDADTVQNVPGENASFDLRLENTGTEKTSKTIVRSDSEQFNVVPSELSLGTLEPGETVEKSLELSSDPEISSGVQKLRMEILYGDGREQTERQASIPVNIVEKAEMAVSDVRTDEPIIGQSTTITVELENLGPGEAERIRSEASCNGAEVENSRSFVGQLGDDESVPLTFVATPTSNQTECTVDVTYRDSQEGSISENFSFSSGEKQDLILPAVGVLVLVAVLVWYGRKRRRDELEEI